MSHLLFCVLRTKLKNNKKLFVLLSKKWYFVRRKSLKKWFEENSIPWRTCSCSTMQFSIYVYFTLTFDDIFASMKCEIFWWINQSFLRNKTILLEKVDCSYLENKWKDLLQNHFNFPPKKFHWKLEFIDEYMCENWYKNFDKFHNLHSFRKVMEM